MTNDIPDMGKYLDNPRDDRKHVGYRPGVVGDETGLRRLGPFRVRVSLWRACRCGPREHRRRATSLTVVRRVPLQEP